MGGADNDKEDCKPTKDGAIDGMEGVNANAKAEKDNFLEVPNIATSDGDWSWTSFFETISNDD